MTAAAPVASPAPPQVLLAHHLRQLKLPTFLKIILDVRARLRVRDFQAQEIHLPFGSHHQSAVAITTMPPTPTMTHQGMCCLQSHAPPAAAIKPPTVEKARERRACRRPGRLRGA
jgi:hypothetical protein